VRRWGVSQRRAPSDGSELAGAKVVDERTLVAVLDELVAGVVVALPDGRVVQNRRASAMTGVRHVDLLVYRAAQELFREPGVERTIEVAGPPTRHFVVRSSAIKTGGAMVRIEDVTERRRVDEVRTDFVANLSHELKTPIGGVAALSDALVGEDDPETVRRLAGRIVSEAHRMATIVDDLLDLSRIEFGSGEMEPLDMADVVREAAGQQQHTAQQAAVTVSVEAAPDSMVVGDRSQLVSAVSNLVENAVKYSNREGEVAVSCRVSYDRVVVVVADHGIGIAAADHERIFERFYRVDKGRSRATGGTGLGLSIVRHVVENHGGTISLQSEEGVGTTFTVSLPAEGMARG
jgi:two-component system sensor histidine kinase SenX3